MPRLPKNLNLSENEVSQSFDFVEEFGFSPSENQGLALTIAQDMIDIIQKRTAKSDNIYNNDFKKYDEDYIESEDFKAFGKTKKVNMKLTGDMLASIDVLEISDSTVKIGINDAEEAAKAYGHMTGMKGHPYLDGKTPKRQFFGINSGEIEKLRNKYKSDIDTTKPFKTAGDVLGAVTALGVAEEQQLNISDIVASFFAEET